MNKRDFIKAGLLAAGIASQLPLKGEASVIALSKKKKKLKNWIWISPNQKDTDDELKTLYAACKAGRYYRDIF